METFVSGDMVRFGWETFKKRPGILIGALLLIIIASVISSNISSALTHQGLVLAVVSFVLSIALSMLIKMGQINFLLKAHDNIEQAKVQNLWAPENFWHYVIASLAYGFIVVGGLILLVVPGIIWGLRFMFTQYIVIDKKATFADALRESSRITDGHKWELLLLVLGLIGLNILGLLCLFVGLLVTVPISELAVTHAYRTLSRIKPAPAPSVTA